MRLKAILLSAFALISLSAAAQDKIYKKNGDVIDGKVKEVNTRSISYKRSDNPDGPDYVINRSEVERIKYQNGSEDYMSEREQEPTRKPQPKINYGGNILSLALINFNDEGFGFGIAYERAIDKKGVINFYLPINLSVGNLNNYDYGYTSGNGNSSFNRSILQIMPGVKFYPTGNQGKVRYAVGPQLAFESGYKEEWQYNYISSSTPYDQYTRASIKKFGILINNSVNMFPSEHIFIGIDLGLGLTYVNKKKDIFANSMVEQGTTQLAQFNFRIGYRF